MDLNNISIPNADLSCAILYNTNLNNANLQNVVFDRTYCNGTKFNNANMNNATFGVLPDIQFGEWILCVDIIKISENK